VAPRAYAASTWSRGVWANTSREIAVTIGKIMMAITSPGHEDRALDGDPGSEQRNEAQIVDQPVADRD
jgi:hypothetical protein